MFLLGGGRAGFFLSIFSSQFFSSPELRSTGKINVAKEHGYSTEKQSQ